MRIDCLHTPPNACDDPVRIGSVGPLNMVVLNGSKRHKQHYGIVVDLRIRCQREENGQIETKREYVTDVAVCGTDIADLVLLQALFALVYLLGSLPSLVFLANFFRVRGVARETGEEGCVEYEGRAI